MEDQRAARFVVELSNVRELNTVAPYERWELDNEEELAARMESELGWSRSESEAAASEVAAGMDFEDTDDETGKIVRAYVKQEAVV
ncbi:MAG TPA: hypothetical protein VLC07_09265 [Solirubrobacterales bacterium]|nr:hypothetical protein [Solirubrobacterales bacterium]